MQNNNSEESQKLLAILEALVAQDKHLRQQYNIGDKFKFVRDGLLQLHQKSLDELNQIKTVSEVKQEGPLEDEVIIYVHLFNAQGQLLPSWQKFLNPSVFYEYSVNRPVYLDLSKIESYIRSRSNKMQHGYLSIIIKKADVLPADPDNPLQQDALGNELVKIREGSLHFDKLMLFCHNDINYGVKLNGELVRKE